MEKTLVLARMEEFLKWNTAGLFVSAAKEVHSILVQGRGVGAGQADQATA